jgi:Tfp pilus assembly protein PilF
MESLALASWQTPKASLQKMTISVNIAEGAILTGEVKFVVKVDAKDPVTNVEFYVGDNIRDTDSSTPYEFAIDTLAEADGPLKVVFAAYTTEGESLKKTLSLTVDNGLSKGADYHVSQGKDFLTERKFDDAIRSGRIALKIQPKYNPARMLLARAFYGKGVLDTAQTFAEDALADDPKFFEAADLLSGVHLRRSFAALNRGGDKLETLNVIRVALKSGVESRRKVLDANVDAFAPVTDANRLQFADLAIRAGRYSLAGNAVSEKVKQDVNDPAYGNRLAYSQMRLSRFDDAAATLFSMKRAGSLDAYSYALWSIIEVIKGNHGVADDLMKEAILVDPDSMGVQAAQAWVALRRGRMAALATLSSKLARDEGQRSEIQYYLAAYYNARGNYVDARSAYERAMLSEPTNHDMLVQRANEALGIVAARRVEEKELDYQKKVALTYYDTALVAKADSAEALTGLALAHIYGKNSTEALKHARASTAAGASYAPAFYIASMVYSKVEADYRSTAAKVMQGAPRGNLSTDQAANYKKLLDAANEMGKEGMAAMKRAEALDQANLRGRNIPEMTEAFNYFARYGRLPLLLLPK